MLKAIEAENLSRIKKLEMQKEYYNNNKITTPLHHAIQSYSSQTKTQTEVFRYLLEEFYEDSVNQRCEYQSMFVTPLMLCCILPNREKLCCEILNFGDVIDVDLECDSDLGLTAIDFADLYENYESLKEIKGWLIDKNEEKSYDEKESSTLETSGQTSFYTAFENLEISGIPENNLASDISEIEISGSIRSENSYLSDLLFSESQLSSVNNSIQNSLQNSLQNSVQNSLQNSVNTSVENLNDHELRHELKSLANNNPGAISTPAIRKIYQRKLSRLRRENKGNKSKTNVSINLLYANIGSWNTRGSHFTEISRKNNCAVGIVTEVNGKLPANAWFNQCLSGHRYRGVGVLWNENKMHGWTSEILNSVDSGKWDILVVKFVNKDCESRGFVVVSVYISASAEDEEKVVFLEAVDSEIEKIEKNHDFYLLIGDWNITVREAAKDLGWSSRSWPLAVKRASQMILKYSLKSVYGGFTWKRGEICTAPDVMMVSKSFDVSDVTCEKLDPIEARKEHFAFKIKIVMRKNKNDDKNISVNNFHNNVKQDTQDNNSKSIVDLT